MLHRDQSQIWVAGMLVAPVFAKDATSEQHAFENPSGSGTANDSLSGLGCGGQFGCVVSTAEGSVELVYSGGLGSD